MPDSAKTIRKKVKNNPPHLCTQRRRRWWRCFVLPPSCEVADDLKNNLWKKDMKFSIAKKSQCVIVILATEGSPPLVSLTCLAFLRSTKVCSKALAKLPIIRGTFEGLFHFLNCTNLNNSIRSTQTLMTFLDLRRRSVGRCSHHLSKQMENRSIEKGYKKAPHL